MAIRSSKGRLYQNNNLRWTLVRNRKANIHINTYSVYYWSDNQSGYKNDYLIFFIHIHTK